jgi:hypothetical protein
MLALFAALSLHVFTNGGGGNWEAGLGLIDITNGHGTITAAKRTCSKKARPEQIQRLTDAAAQTRPKTWRPSYNSDCLECAGFTVELGKKHVTFDQEAKLPPDLERFRKAVLRELEDANKRCPIEAPKQP